MGLSYSETSLVIWIVLFSILSAICFVIQMVLKALARRSIKSAAESFDDFSHNVAEVRLSCWVRVLTVLGIWGCPIFLSIALLSLSVFDLMPWYGTALLIGLILLIYWAWISTFASLLWTVLFSKDNQAVKKKFFDVLLDGDELDDGPISENRYYDAKKSLFGIGFRQGIPLLIVILLIFGICWFFSGVCMTFSPISISFKGMRVLSSEDCRPGLKPCLVYLNVADNSSSTMFVVFHATYKMTNPVVKLSISSQSNPLDYEITVPAEYIEMNLEVTRFVYMAYLSHLDPHRIHFFVAGDGQVIDSFSSERQFRPTDSSLARMPLRIISGGDVGLRDGATKMISLAASKHPDLIVFGGDLAYANGMKTCYRRWDRWLKMYSESAITPSGLSVPLLTAIGNHEAGGFNMKRSNSPFYLNYFFHQGFNTVPESMSQSKTMDPATKFRPTNVPPNTYHAHDLAGTSLIILDSGVLAAPDGAQRAWLEATLNHSRNGPHKASWAYAAYHRPMYPSVAPLDNKGSTQLRAAWEDVFATHKLDMAFENHDHAFKRSYPIVNGVVLPAHAPGTIYLGDGSMGVKPRKPAAVNKRDYLVTSEQDSFFFLVSFTPHNVTVQAINEQNIVFDYHVIPRRH